MDAAMDVDERCWQQLTDLERRIDELAEQRQHLKRKQRQNVITATEALDLAGIEDQISLLERRSKRFCEILKNAPTAVSQKFRDADMARVALVTGVEPATQPWNPLDDAAAVDPPPELPELFERISKGFYLTTSAAVRRKNVEMFLLNVASRPEFRGRLRIFPSVAMSVEASRGAKQYILHGTLDYAVGRVAPNFDKFDSRVPEELGVVALGVAADMKPEDLQECIAQTAAVYKRRTDAMASRVREDDCKVCVWGFVTDAETWPLTRTVGSK
ncbi:hypothetical protein HDU96_003664 [Phlyctochytrium bullatum]|nr:hypothetical protein HDU96_003664 [Phlyctochytrium bullatum]